MVDDGSTDESLEILATYGDRIRVISRENGGQAAGMNTGIEAARGEFICFLDSDDFWLPNKVAAVVDAFGSSGASLVCHDLLLLTGSDPYPRELWSVVRNTEMLEGDLEEVLVKKGLPWVFASTSGLSMPTRIARRIASIPEDDWRICADNPLAIGAAFLGLVCVLRNPLAIYRDHGKNGYSGNLTPERRREIARDFPRKRLKFLKDFLGRQGRTINLDFETHYEYQKTFCLMIMRSPVFGLPRLWRANIHRYLKGEIPLRSLTLSLFCDTVYAICLMSRLPNKLAWRRLLFWGP